MAAASRFIPRPHLAPTHSPDSAPWPPGAQTTESLLAKEREAREAAAKELLQYKLLLAEAEGAQALVQQERQAALAKATREAAAAAELRGQLEALQVGRGTRREEALPWDGEGLWVTWNLKNNCGLGVHGNHQGLEGREGLEGG